MLFPHTRLRVSDYNIYVDSAESDQWAVAHGYMGVADRLDRATFMWLQSGMQHGSVSPETRRFLHERGYLTTRTVEQEHELIREILKRHIRLQSQQASFTAILSYDCNFRCTYCIQRIIQNKGNGYIKEGMSDEVMDSAFRFIESFGSEPTVTLYGGEPFGDGNQHRVERFLNWVHGQGIKVHAISNGYDWHLFDEQLVPDTIRSIQVTIDGPPEIHNRRRIALGERDSFWTIIKHVRWALERGIQISMRINCDRNNLPHLEGLTHLFTDEGLYDFPGLFSAYLSPVQGNWVMKDDKPLFSFGEMYQGLLEAHDPSCGGGCHCDNGGGSCRSSEGVTSDDGILFNTDYLPSARFELRRVLDGKQKLPYKMTYCGAYSGMYVLDPFGKIYGCWDFADNPEHVMGTFHPSFELFQSEVDLWRKRTEEVLMKQCVSCPYVLLHGSGCQAEAYRRTGNFWERDCQDFDAEFDLAMRSAMGAVRIGSKSVPTISSEALAATAAHLNATPVIS